MAHPDPHDTTGIPAGTKRLPEDGLIERVEERAVIGKRVVDQGGIRVATRTETLRDTLRDTLQDVTVEVERVPVGRFVEAAEGPRVEGDVTILPVYEERLVVERRLFLVEEVHVRRQARSREVELPVELRRQVAEVERLAPLGQSPSPDTHQGVTRMMDDIYSGSRTVTAMFDSSAEAERAVSRLRAASIPDNSIRVTQGATSATGTVDYNDTTYRDQHKGFWDSLSDFFFPDEDRYTYAEGLARGSHMVTVTNIDTAMHDTVIDILDDEGSVDLSARESEWRSSGWSGYTGSASAGMAAAATGVDMNTRGTIFDDGMQDRSVQMAADTGRRSQADLGSQQAGYADTGSMRQTTGMGTTGTGMGYGSEGWRGDELNEDGTVKVVEERLNVGKRDVDLGSVRVRSYVREEPVSADVNLRSTRVHVERRPVDRAVNPGDLSMRDQVIEAREHTEEPVVAKEARVVEEIGLRKETETRHETVQDTVRRTDVEIEDDRTGERTNLTGDRMKDRDRF